MAARLRLARRYGTSTRATSASVSTANAPARPCSIRQPAFALGQEAMEHLYVPLAGGLARDEAQTRFCARPSSTSRQRAISC
jgi:hypothetical protein